MIVLNGKYNFAKVFLPADQLEPVTKEQIEGFLNHPAFRGRKIRIMPDTHAGKGSCVGFTMDFGGAIIPNIIGVDIGCGIMATKLPSSVKIAGGLEYLDRFVRKNVPSGFSIHGEVPQDVSKSLWDKLYYASETLSLDHERVLKSLGTLGGGNHFIELGEDADGNLWLTIHSGSRNFGLQVAQKFQRIADTRCAEYFQDWGDLNFLPDSDRDYNSYINNMVIAQEFAHNNRKKMTNIILEGFFGCEPAEQIDSVHNYIDFNDGIIRKGATAANVGQKLVIPFNMQDGLIIATGKGNPDWNFSAPHGAGRILSRSAAKKQLSIDEAKAGMDSAGVFTTSLSAETLDEAKGAYKDKDLILEMIQDTVEVNTFVKPIYNFKAK